jgi:proline iminopeptidase
MAEVDAGGVRLFWTEEGSGPPFIVLHGGLGFDHTYLKHSFHVLADVMRLVYVDQRGNGRSERVPLETITIAQLAADVDAFADAIGLERFGLIGHSYGGFVALEYATTYPGRVTHLICNDTSPGAFQPSEAELAARPDPSWITPEVENAMRFLTRPFPTDPEVMRAAFPEVAPVYMRGSTAPLLASTAGMIFEPSVSAHSMAVALPGWSVADKLDRITAATLVACGRYDLLTTPECSVRLASAIRDAELVWFENSAHFPELEEPDAFFGAIRDWLRRHP